MSRLPRVLNLAAQALLLAVIDLLLIGWIHP